MLLFNISIFIVDFLKIAVLLEVKVLVVVVVVVGRLGGDLAGPDGSRLPGCLSLSRN